MDIRDAGRVRRLLLISGRNTLGWNTYGTFINDVQHNFQGLWPTPLQAAAWVVEVLYYTPSEEPKSLKRRACATILREARPFDVVLAHSQGGAILAASLPDLVKALKKEPAKPRPLLIFSHALLSLEMNSSLRLLRDIPPAFDGLRQCLMRASVPKLLLNTFWEDATSNHDATYDNKTHLFRNIIPRALDGGLFWEPPVFTAYTLAEEAERALQETARPKPTRAKG